MSFTWIWPLDELAPADWWEVDKDEGDDACDAVGLFVLRRDLFLGGGGRCCILKSGAWSEREVVGRAGMKFGDARGVRSAVTAPRAGGDVGPNRLVEL